MNILVHSEVYSIIWIINILIFYQNYVLLLYQNGASVEWMTLSADVSCVNFFKPGIKQPVDIFAVFTLSFPSNSGLPKRKKLCKYSFFDDNYN